jgi:LPS export ABC transporter protein LptC
VKRQWVLLAAVPVLGAVLLTLQRADQSESTAEMTPAALPRYTARQATLSRFDAEGVNTLRGTADSVEYFDDDSSQAADLHVDLISDGAVQWQLAAPTGTMPPHERRILLGGPVNAKGEWPDNGVPMTIDTTQVWVDTDSHQFETRERVNVNSEARYGTAVGMRVNWDERHLQLLHNVKMTYVAP